MLGVSMLPLFFREGREVMYMYIRGIDVAIVFSGGGGGGHVYVC